MKTILITGASSGIGAALAETYAAADVTLWLCGRNEARLAAVAALCRQKGAKVETAQIDVTDKQTMAKQIESWLSTGAIDLVIANAGISAGLSGGTEAAAQTRKIFDVNITGVLNTVLPIIPVMQKQRSGQIALVSSLAGLRGLPSAPAYSASKNAIRAWGEALRLSLKPAGIKINVICPGFIKTPLTDSNPFPMPLLMTTQKAACLIQKGLEKNKARIVFPRRLYLAVRLLTLLPVALSDFIADRLPRK